MAIIKNRLGKEIILSCKIHMVGEENLDGGPKGEGRVSLTQYLEFQED